MHVDARLCSGCIVLFCSSIDGVDCLKCVSFHFVRLLLLDAFLLLCLVPAAV
jgi:hypothetical protein